MIFFSIIILNYFFDVLKGLLNGHIVLYHAIIGTIIGVATIAAGKIVKFLLSTVGRKLISKTESTLDDIILKIILERIIAISCVLGLYLALKELRLGLTSGNTNFLTFIEYSNHVLYVVSAIIVISVVIRIVNTLVTHTLTTVADRNDPVGKSIAPLVNRVATFLIALIAIMIVLDHFGQNFSSVLTILGAGSLALGLAAQDTISNMISGFIIMIDRPFRVGDRIKISTGETGDIFEIGLRSTKILDFDNNLIIFPNNELIKTRIVNYNYPDGEIRIVVDFTTAHGTDIDRVKQIVLKIANAHPKVLTIPVAEIFFVNITDWFLQFRLVCRVDSFKIQFTTAEEMRVSIYKEFIKEKIEIPFPQQFVQQKATHLVDVLPM